MRLSLGYTNRFILKKNVHNKQFFFHFRHFENCIKSILEANVESNRTINGLLQRRQYSNTGFLFILGHKGWLAITKLIPLSLFISLLLMPNEAFDNVKIEK